MELLVFVQDKIHPDFYLNTKFPKRGDVLVAKPDGWKWGTEELADGRFRIIHALGLAEEDAEILLAPEIDIDPKNPSRVLQFRAFKLDLDNVILGKNLVFFSDHSVVDVVAKGGDLKAIEQKDTVYFKTEEVTILKDAQNNPIGFETLEKVEIADIIKFPVAEITADLPGIDIVGAKIRLNAIIQLDADVIKTIKTLKPRIIDPAVIGDPINIFG